MRWHKHFANAFLTRREPFSIVHFLTDRCNARCPHCFLDFDVPIPPSEHLTLGEIRHLTATMGDNLYNVNLTGGEPFLRDDLFDIVAAYCERARVRSVVITTNGTLLAALQTFLDRVKRSGLRGRVKLSISIDHYEERHDALRNVRGAYRKALQAYEMVGALRDDRVMADVALTVTPYNHREIGGVHAALKESGVRHFSAILMREEGRVKRVQDKEEVVGAYRDLVTRILADGRSRRALSVRHRVAEAVRSAKNEIVSRAGTNGDHSSPRGIPCEAGSLFGVIAANGDVLPCEVLDGAWRLGNVRDTQFDFLRIWRGNTASKVRGMLRHSPCRCTYECAWSVNVLTRPTLMPRLFLRSCRNLL